MVAEAEWHRRRGSELRGGVSRKGGEEERRSSVPDRGRWCLGRTSRIISWQVIDHLSWGTERRRKGYPEGLADLKVGPVEDGQAGGAAEDGEEGAEVGAEGVKLGPLEEAVPVHKLPGRDEDVEGVGAQVGADDNDERARRRLHPPLP